MGMSTDLYVYRDEDKHAVAIARPQTGQNGGFSAHHVAMMALPGLRLTQDEIDGFANLFVAAPDMLEAANRVLDYATLDDVLDDPGRHDNGVFAIRIGDLRALRAAIAKAEGGAQ